MDGECTAFHPSLAMLVCLLSLLTLARSHHSIGEVRRRSVTAEWGGRCIKMLEWLKWDQVGPDCVT